jgi:hypothetical protein
MTGFMPAQHPGMTDLPRGLTRHSIDESVLNVLTTYYRWDNMSKAYDSQLRGYRTPVPGRMKKDPTYPIFEQGVQLGARLAVKAMLDRLEAKYLTDEDRPDRHTPEAKAILEVARELGKLTREFKPVIPE